MAGTCFFAAAGVAFVIVDLTFFADEVYFLAAGMDLVLVALVVLGLVVVELVALAFKGFLTAVLFFALVAFFAALGLDPEVASFLAAGLSF